LSWRLALESCLGRLARWLGIIFVSIQALINFLFIPAQLFWAIILILIDLWIIYARSFTGVSLSTSSMLPSELHSQNSFRNRNGSHLAPPELSEKRD
jgi:hypothetical protein